MGIGKGAYNLGYLNRIRLAEAKPMVESPAGSRNAVDMNLYGPKNSVKQEVLNTGADGWSRPRVRPVRSPCREEPFWANECHVHEVSKSATTGKGDSTVR